MNMGTPYFSLSEKESHNDLGNPITYQLYSSRGQVILMIRANNIPPAIRLFIPINIVGHLAKSIR